MPLPDDGLIHAWLDGQLPPDEAARVEQMVQSDAGWAAAAADARGLIAASARILSALDHVPSGVLPKRPMAPTAWRLPWWTKVAAVVVLMVGASTLLLVRAPKPEIVRVTQGAKPAEPTIAPSAPAVARPAVPAPGAVRKETPLARRPAAGAAVAAVSGAASGVPSRNAPEPGAPVPAPVLAAPSPSLVVQSGAVAEQQAKIAVTAEQAPRQQVTDQVRQGAQQLLVQRTAAEPSAAKSFAARDAAPAPSPNVVGGVAMEKRTAPAVRPGACYRLHDNRTSTQVGPIMRIGRIDGDTLRLESVQAASLLRAWVVLRDGTARGVLTTEPGERGMVLVTALPVSCPAP